MAVFIGKIMLLMQLQNRQYMSVIENITKSHWRRENYVGPSCDLVIPRVHLTGNGQTGPVPVWDGTKPAQIQNLNLNSKK